MWVVDIRHWINEETEDAAAPQLVRNVERMKKIIAYTTLKATGMQEEGPLRCWKRPKRKFCKGILDTGFECPDRIYWKCRRCGFEGVVYGWNGLSCNLLHVSDRRFH